MTIPELPKLSRNWKGIDGAIAWHLIDRHANGWAEVGAMMDAWLAANRTPSPPSGWLGIESAPVEGVHLTYLAEPMLGSRYAVVKAHPNVSLVGGVFSFDAPKPIAWMPLPPPPEDRT